MIRALALTLLVACGDSAEDQLKAATEANAAGDYPAAQKAVDAGLAAGPKGATEWRLQLAGLEAKAKGNDCPGTKGAIEGLAGSHKAQVKASLYNQTAGQIKEAGDGGCAIEVLDLGIKRFAGDKDLEKAIEQAKAGGSDAEMDQLRSLGYIE